VVVEGLAKVAENLAENVHLEVVLPLEKFGVSRRVAVLESIL
jgi:hypothetical protein